MLSTKHKSNVSGRAEDRRLPQLPEGLGIVIGPGGIGERRQRD
jgi:hypothetical protein